VSRDTTSGGHHVQVAGFQADLAPATKRPLAGAFLFDRQLFWCAMTYHVVVIFSIYLFIAVAMLATIWKMEH
jgi:hypothetical protein